MKKTLTLALIMGASFMAPNLQATELQALKNMERERATLINTLRDDSLEPETRHVKLMNQRQRLIDLERMVLRDDRLLGHKDKLVALTFRDYELSFLIHASAEADQNPVEHWLAEVGLSADDVMEARVGRR